MPCAGATWSFQVLLAALGKKDFAIPVGRVV